MTKLELGIAAALLSTAPAGARPGPTQLASIDGIALGPDEFVDRFTIDTWGVDMIAICHIPPGWTIKAGRQASPDGVIAGEASHGVTFLNRPRLGELGGLALIRLGEPVQRQAIPIRGGGEHPATFAGRARIGRYGLDERRREVRLTYANVRLTPATRCPPPR